MTKWHVLALAGRAIVSLVAAGVFVVRGSQPDPWETHARLYQHSIDQGSVDWAIGTLTHEGRRGLVT